MRPRCWHRNCTLDAAGWMSRLWNHPAVVMWVLRNESRRDNAWEEGPFQDFVNALDPTRPTLRTGSTGTRDNYDVHTCGHITDPLEGNLNLDHLIRCDASHVEVVGHNAHPGPQLVQLGNLFDVQLRQQIQGDDTGLPQIQVLT